MSSVLFDVPGPKARTRNVFLNVFTVLVVVGIIAFILYRFNESGQFTAKKWEIFTFPRVQQMFLTVIGATLKAFAASAVGSLVLGILLAFGRLADSKWVRVPCYWFTELFRAIPVLVLMMIVYYGLPSAGVKGITPFIAVVVGLILYNGSVLAEVFRAGIESLPKGQREAGLAVGLSKGQVQRIILLPQAVRSMLPVIISQLVVILKDTALGFLITYNEVLYYADFLGSQGQYGSPVVPALMVTAVIYVGLCLILSGIAKLVESKMSSRVKVVKTRVGLAG
ncbi:glutamate transport system permease protein [Arthrobacter silviterrae]|uniref:Amino acid ABC transporter permease n=1 Tax=Arthrobacter silviterrae TaxID=2026658 RepID=A0ABX0D7L2_9MICC|nr:MULTISPECIES: amino acid ABC transporter permease [Arthrobacter]MCU6479396.1 amino acid ABC transporter permease [Arthrobacter sp. A2-55]MDQ0277253.1 glutamate transport system permease protein [Arthrobacter silviterrae]NGN82864.1 amino acid ABC transporter permease [Arthrobacter silviterrae]